MSMSELFVTNFNPRYTGVSSTAAGIIGVHKSQYNLSLVGHALPGAPDPISSRQALRMSRTPPQNRPFVIWHVRRNPEMRLGIWARDILRLPVKLVFTSAAQRRHSALPRWLISKMDAVIATSQNAAHHVPNVKAIAPHGVDCATWFPSDNRMASWAQTGFPGKRGKDSGVRPPARHPGRVGRHV